MVLFAACERHNWEAFREVHHSAITPAGFAYRVSDSLIVSAILSVPFQLLGDKVNHSVILSDAVLHPTSRLVI
jgi:hypothetical protein